MFIAIYEFQRYAHCCKWNEALWLMLYKEYSFMLIAIHVVKLHAHYYTWSED